MLYAATGRVNSGLAPFWDFVCQITPGYSRFVRLRDLTQATRRKCVSNRHRCVPVLRAGQPANGSLCVLKRSFSRANSDLHALAQSLPNQTAIRSDSGRNSVSNVYAIGPVLLGLVGILGCQRAEEIRYVSSKAVQELPKELQQKVVAELTKYCGTPDHPKLLGNDKISSEHLQHGALVFQERCAACHGVTGDGAGVAAQYMNPSPRDYRPGSFKFTSTAYGNKPLREDLVRIIRNGARGTSMPAFNLLSNEDLQAVVDYVMVLTHRGELEKRLAAEADNEEDIDPEMTPELADAILAQWAGASENVVLPISRPVPYSLESVEKGRQAFFTETAGCMKCHGKDGRGQDIPNFIIPGTDEPVTVRSADLTAGMFHGGSRSEDIYRRIFAGINGTPMPAFGDSLAQQPETLWNLVHFVQYISSSRRRDVVEHAPVLKQAAKDSPDETQDAKQLEDNAAQSESTQQDS